ncbi:MAG: MBL fold metallo-hydrolase [Melioribacteraceae bacterium]|nr:MBL fold metallo-hydrolase [Melioribacteraceae bacterium]
MSLKIKVLGSSSSGNATLIWNSKGGVLIDCGFTLRNMTEKLEEINLSFKDISCLLISHMHSDHVNNAVINRLVNENIQILLNYKLLAPIRQKYSAINKAVKKGLVKLFNEEELIVNGFRIKNFQVPHDSHGGCYGFNIVYNGQKISIATDIGYSDNSIIERFYNSDLIVLESNHDDEMLHNSGRPHMLIERIKNIGHLSNEQCGEILSTVAENSENIPKQIILAHLSKECNTHDKAMNIVSVALKDKIDSENIYTAHHSKGSEILEV